LAEQCRVAAASAVRSARLKRHDIDDLAQESAVRTLRALQSMASEGRDVPTGAGLRGFVAQVAANAAHELARAERHARRRLRRIDEVAPHALRARFVPLAPIRDRAACLSGAEPWLTETDRVLVSRLLSGASLDVIAAMLGRGRGAVRRRVVILMRAAESPDPAAVVTAADEAAARRGAGSDLAAAALRTGADSLDSATRTTLELRAGGATPTEIAAVLGVSRAAIRQRLSRATRFLRCHTRTTIPFSAEERCSSSSPRTRS
jgi:DNA-directed RNA polymerase specialized sigma24 family protein